MVKYRVGAVYFVVGFFCIQGATAQGEVVRLEATKSSFTEGTDNFITLTAHSTDTLIVSNQEVFIDIAVTGVESETCIGQATQSDYTIGSVRVTIPAGSPSAEVAITLIDDNLLEVLECLGIFIQSMFSRTTQYDSSYFDDRPVPVEIVDNDIAMIQLEAAKYNLTENKDTRIIFRAQSNASVQEDYGSIIVDLSFNSVNVPSCSSKVTLVGENPETSFISIRSGRTSGALVIILRDDDDVEMVECLIATISDVTWLEGRMDQIRCNEDVIVIRIEDDDKAMVYLEVNQSSVNENTERSFDIFVRTTKPILEGHGSIMVDIEVGPSIEPLSGCSQYVTSADYMLETNQVAVPGGSLSAAITVYVVDDEFFDQTECFVASIQAASWEEGSPEQISFDDSPVVIYITDPDDVNECELITNPCEDSMATCVNTEGCYGCVSLESEGYTWTIYTCTGGISTGQGFCPPDQNNCPSELHNCFIFDNGASFCACELGYRPDTSNLNRCEDVNECTSSPNPCDTTTSTCVNTQGSYRCDCIDSYIRGPTENSCVERPYVFLVESSINIGEADGEASVAVGLSNSYLNETVSITFVTTDVTAFESFDYLVEAPSVIFQPGFTSVTLTIQILDDMVLEKTETFDVSIGNAMNVSVDPTRSTTAISIIDDDQAAIRLEALEETVTEGDDVYVTLVATSDHPVDSQDIQIEIELGTTVAQNCNTLATTSDFSMGSHSLTLLEGPEGGLVTATVSVPILNDDVPEYPECLVASITSLIWDEVRPEQLRIHNSNTVVIPIMDDDIVDECELGQDDCDRMTTSCRDTLDLYQCDCLGGFTPGVDNRTCFEKPYVMFLNNSIEVPESSGIYFMILTLSNLFLTETLTIPLITEADTATYGVDYEIDTTVTFMVGSNTASCSLEIFDDDIIEITETFTISIGNVDDVRVDPAASEASVSIIDDDRAFIRMETSEEFITEGVPNAITLTARSNATVQNEYGGFLINLEVVPTASQDCFGVVSDSDYEMESRLISIAGGSLSGAISVSILDDEYVEAQECLVVSIQSVTWAGQEGISFDASPLVIRIIDTDIALVAINQNDVLLNEGTSVQIGVSSSRPIDGIDIVLGLDLNSRLLPGDTRIQAGTLSSVMTITALENEVVEGVVSLQTEIHISLETRGSVRIDGVGQRIRLQTNQLRVDIEDNDEALLAFRSARQDILESKDNVNITFYFTKKIRPLYLPQSIDFEINYGDADASDFEVSTTTLRNLRGDGTDEIFPLRIVDDRTVEEDETFTLSLRDGQDWPRVHIDQSSASSAITIIDNDRDDRAILQVSRTKIDVEESQGALLVSFWISKPLDTISEIDVMAVNISAYLGSDYSFTPEKLTIPPGENQTSVQVQIIDDNVIEPTEEFRVMVTNCSPLLRFLSNDAVTSVVIRDDDAQISGYYVSMVRSDVTVSEGDGKVEIPVQLGSDEIGTVSIRFVITEGSAKNGMDYESQPTDSIVYQDTTFLEIPIISDSLAEEMETFKVSILSTDPNDLQVFNSTTTVTIIDDDTACVRILADNTLVEESDGEVTTMVSLPYKLDKSISVDLASTPVTAQSDDFIQLRGSVLIPANTLSASVTFRIVDDTTTEENEAFIVRVTGVSSPASVCQGISTTTITILRNDQGPSVVYCPNDITVFTIEPEENIFVTWEQAQFERGQDQIGAFGGINVTAATLRAGESKNVIMTATDVVGRKAVCSFDVSVLLQGTTDLKAYIINVTVLNTDDDSTELSKSRLKEWLSSRYRRGNCSQKGYAGIDLLTLKSNTGFTEVTYKLLLVMSSECCIQDAVIDFNERLTSDPSDSSIDIDINSHLPDVTFLQGSIRMNVSMGYDASIYENPNHSQTKLLRNLMITQLTTNMSDTNGFVGVCVFPFKVGSVLARLVYEFDRGIPLRFDEIEVQFLNFVTSINVTEGLIAPSVSDVSLRRICTDDKCNNQGFCFVPPSDDYIPDCRCDVGYMGDNCGLRDFRYCVRTDTIEDGLEIQLPSGLRNTIIFRSDFRNNPCAALDYDDEEDLLQIIWAECIDSGGDTVWNYTVNCNATLGEYLAFLLTIPIREENVVEVSMQLANASSRLDSDGGADEIVQVASLFRNITESSGTLNPSVLDSLAMTMSNLMGANMDNSTDLENSGASNDIVQAFESGLSRVVVDNETGSYSAQSENVAVIAVEVDTPMLNTLGIATLPSKEANDTDSIFEDIMQVNSSDEQETINMGASNIFLYPKTIASNLPERVKVTFAVYRTPVLFSSRFYEELNMNQSIYNRRKRRSVIPYTRVVSSSLFAEGEEITEFNTTYTNDRFRQWYQPLNQDGTFSNFETINCSFWSFHADGGRGNWLTNGCEFVGIEKGLIKCECNHLTNFAVLMDVYEHDSLTEVQYTILEAVTFFGCAASILGLSVTLVAFTSQRNLRSKRPNQILMFMCSHLLALYITFLVMVVFDSERTTEFLPPLQCGILAGVMHFITIASLFWMLVEGVNMYFLFVRIVNTHVHNFMFKAVLFADGVPLVIVGLTVVITKFIFKEDYSRQSVCFVNAPYPVIGGVAAPISIIIILNLVLYVMVIYRLSNRVSTSSRSARREKKERKKRFQNAISIMLLMGLTWGFSYFCFIPAGQNFSFAVQLLFSALNSMQGYLIFMFYCMRNPEFRKRWRHLCFCLCPMTFPLQKSLSSRIVSTLSKDKNSQDKKFRATSVPESSIEQRRRNAFPRRDDESFA